MRISSQEISLQDPTSHIQLLTSLRRIECYDISNLSGQFSVGSMVVFINGIADKSQYRRFRIKMSGQPNDVAMMQEMLGRRLKHQEWPYPDLIIVDGGKPQVTAALEVMQCHSSLPVIGLAKRLETIIIPILRHPELDSGSVRNRMLKKFQHDDLRFEEINLPLNSSALNLLKRLRDEAHRFAISYHRKLRMKQIK